jgi:hypothetical protein
MDEDIGGVNRRKVVFLVKNNWLRETLESIHRKYILKLKNKFSITSLILQLYFMFPSHVVCKEGRGEGRGEFLSPSG